MTLSYVKLYRRYTILVGIGPYLTKRFITMSARTREYRPVDICVDIGAGNAPYKGTISKCFGVNNYVALDFAPSDATNVVGDATSLPIQTQSVELVVCFEALQHISHYHTVLDETVRILRPGGRIILSVPFVYGECDVKDFRRWTIAGITEDLEERGFSVLSVARRGGPFFAIASIMIWAIQHVIPGSRITWRSPRTAAAYFREGLVWLLAFPLILLSWLAVGLDSMLPARGLYAGSFIFAGLDQRRRSTPTLNCGAIPREHLNKRATAWIWA